MRRYLSLLVLLLTLPAGRAAPSGGTVTGRVIVVEDGEVNTPSKDVPAYVYLEEVPAKHRKGNLGDNFHGVIEHRGEKYEPHVLVVPVGGTVVFPNSDHEEHNAFSPTPKDPFDLGRYGFGARPNRRFFEAAELDIFCDIHKDMWAKVKVIDSAWFAQVQGGMFAITNVPPGRYKVVAWLADSLEVRSAEITVKAGEAVSLRSELHLQARKPKPHVRKDGKAYGPYPPK